MTGCISQAGNRQCTIKTIVTGNLAAAPPWWSQAGSNRRPPACKAGALPAELWPHEVVGLGRFELPTSPLSGVRSNQLSYRPKIWGQSENPLQPRPNGHLKVRRIFTLTPNFGRGRLPCLKSVVDFQVTCVGRSSRGSACSLKEVIQPQVPLRLPCYDFTPVMNHTVVVALPKVKLTTSGATHSHGVTGGVYKARERIHRDNADSRLLAIPTSRSRVADCDPD